jgi:MoaA/NifB/PqqE/SkfB family radical SAM enzyme
VLDHQALDKWRRVVTLVLTGLPYMTPVKLLNMIRGEQEKWRRVVRPQAFPYLAVIDVANLCNLRCPYCPTGARRKSGRAESLIDPLLVERMLDELDKYLISVNLYNWGEPLLHPQIAAMVRMIHNRRIFTKISTNLNTDNQEVLVDLCEAGLDYLTVSLSGASQEVYGRYHRGGNLDVVLENIRYVAAYKKRNNLRRPIIEFMYLVFKHNRQEMKDARHMAAELGVESFRWFAGGGPGEATIQASSAAADSLSHNFCHHLWNMVVLNSDGGILPCCYLFFKRDDFGNYAPARVMEVRNNPCFVTARKLFNASEAVDLPRTMQHPCLKCEVVHNQLHLREYLALNPYGHKDHRTGGP